jgi:hypothetical protein
LEDFRQYIADVGLGYERNNQNQEREISGKRETIMILRLIFVLSLALAAINAHAQTPDLQSEIDELRRLIHIQSESINELSGKVEVLQKSVKDSLQTQSKAIENTDKMVHLLQQEIDILSARVSPKSER